MAVDVEECESCCRRGDRIGQSSPLLSWILIPGISMFLCCSCRARRSQLYVGWLYAERLVLDV